MGNFLQPVSLTSSSATGGFLGARLAYASPAGTIAAAPMGFNSTTGRLLVTLPGGAAIWISLTAGSDGQLLEIRNQDSTNTLTLPQASWGGVGDLILSAGNSVLTYYDSTVASWRLTAP